MQSKILNYFFKERHKSAHPSVVNIMVEMAGDSVAHLRNEIEKVCLWAGDRNEITSEDIELFSGWKREHQRWEFLLALGGKDYDRTIALGKTIITSNESMISLIYSLTTLFQEMLFAKMKNGTLHTGKNHTKNSKVLVHFKDLSKKAKKVARA